MNTETHLVIETEGLKKTYKNVQAIKSLNLKVPEHSIFGFLGPNGAGKTTTIKMLLGLIPPTSGTGKVFGYDITRQSLAICQRVGYLAQDPRFYEYMTARETLQFTAGFFFKGPKSRIEERIQETMALVGLLEKADRPVKTLSGGERQRLGIAQAQVNYPDLLILDEPAASLDPQGRHDVLEVMERLRKYTTIFYSTHILDDVQKVSDTVAILNRGELVAQAPIEDLLSTSGQTVYRLVTQGDPQVVKTLLAGQSWITGITIQSRNGSVTWQINVTDPAQADQNIFRLLSSNPSVNVTELGRSRVELEDVFLSLTSEGNHGE